MFAATFVPCRNLTGISSKPLLLVLLATAFSATDVHVLRAEQAGDAGHKIYVEQCAKCHGNDGQGVADVNEQPLGGMKSLAELVKLIDETMPEEAPETCSGQDAELVAKYVFETFYSAAAKEEIAAARIRLSRLTVRQYLSTAADLMAEFKGLARVGEQRGLKAEYFKDRRFRGDQRAEQRIDPLVDFDFGDKVPHEKVPNAEEFSIRWQGSVLAEDTGDYEFILQTVNGARLWVNDNNTPLIDAWVSSKGQMSEHRGTIRLIGGRPYPIRLDTFKFKESAASIRLEWQPPHKAREVVPERNLSPDQVPSTLVIQTPFPPDDRVSGYERGVSVSAEWNEAATNAAIEIATVIVDNLDQLVRSSPDASDRGEKARQFCRRFAEIAFRRPLTQPQINTFVDSHFDAADDVKAAVKRSVLFVLTSPRFLYPSIGSETVDDYTIASRLSYGLWDSLPDRELLAAAAQGKLRSPEQVALHAKRMLNDPRAKSKLRYFFHDWLQMDEKEELVKDESLYPRFDSTLAADLRTSLDLFIENVVWSDASDYRELLLANELFLNPRLAEFYGVELDESRGFHKLPLPDGTRAGVVTHPYLLSAFAYHNLSSPIHRGVFVTRRLLGRSLKPPPQATEFKDGDFEPHMTTREKVEVITKPAACQSCHSIINPLGFSLEHFDAVGRFRATEQEKAIDAESDFETVDGRPIRFNGARSLAEYIVSDRHAHAAFVDQLFHQAVKQPINAFGPNVRDELTEKFVAGDFNIRNLLVEIMQVAALRPDR